MINKLLFILWIMLENARGTLFVSTNSLGECVNMYGVSFEQDRLYVPGPDLCQLCVCDNGQPKGCKSVLCAPPQECKSFQIGNNCCDFICLDNTIGTSGGNNVPDKNSDFGLRLVATGVTVTLSLSLLFFIVNRLRQRKIRMRVNRQISEEQRNMGSIGYIGGNVNYMGGGSLNMEYPFENHPGHYHLWKPPSGYFPRGEAPPPYEEAVALAQAESLSAQCTVSVATTTHRTIPMNICPNENSCEISPNITSSTTNLINININNSGNITSVAAGENHQLHKDNFSSPRNITNQIRSAPQTLQSQHQQQHNYGSMTNNNNNSNTHPHHNNPEPAQHSGQLSSQFLCDQQQHFDRIEQPLGNNIDNQLVECNYKNCTVLKSCCNKPQPPLPIPQQQLSPNTQADCYGSSYNCATTAPPDEVFYKSRNRPDHTTKSLVPTATILPPPLFDEHPTPSQAKLIEMPAPAEPLAVGKIPSSSRRHHRSIPRHFTTSDPLIGVAKSPVAKETVVKKTSQSSSSSTSSTSKSAKLICQCPVQHVPMTFEGTARDHQTEVFLSNLSKKLNNPKPSYVTDHRKPDAMLKSSSSTKELSISGGGVSVGSDGGSQSSTLRRSKPSNKIPTISKEIVYHGGFYVRQQQQQQHHQQEQNHQIHSILKSSPQTVTAAQLTRSSKRSDKTVSHGSGHHTSSSSAVAALNDSKNISSSSTLPLQLIDSVVFKSITPENPVLPPKMFKNSTPPLQPKSQPSPLQQLTPHIQTISKSNDNFMLSGAAHHHHHHHHNHNNNNHSSKSASAAATRTSFPSASSQLSHTKTLPRAGDDRLLSYLQHPMSAASFNASHHPATGITDKSYIYGKINFNQSFPKLTNHYTLPKATNGGKLSMISDVVSKVPSIVNIPSSVIMPDAGGALPLPATAQPPSQPATLSSPARVDQPLQKPQNGSSSTTTTTDIAATITACAVPPSTVDVQQLQHEEKQPLPVCTTYKNCSNPKEHFLPNDTSLDDDYLSECENCKSAHGSRYYLDEPVEEQPQETMTLQRKMDDKQEDEQTYYRTSSTLPSNTKQKNATLKNREPWFSTIPASSSSEDEPAD